MLQIAFQDKAHFKIFNILFNVNFAINLTQAREPIGRFHHTPHGHSNKNPHPS